MPRELITLQVGQCGSQIGSRFWQLALEEFSTYNHTGQFDEALSAFFRNFDAPQGGSEIKCGSHDSIANLRARAIMVDTESGVQNVQQRSHLRTLFDRSQYICTAEQTGSGNNWAIGHHEYGPRYRAPILDAVRRMAESCDSLQSFFIMHSLGGGTGSGLGTYLVRQLHDEYPSAFRFSAAVLPSDNDDVIPSPYNAVLALAELAEHADCVLPLENEALIDLGRRISDDAQTLDGDPATAKQGKPFDLMNDLAARVLTDLTSGMRFEGALNVDLNEITTNLVPFPSMHFLTAAVSPLIRRRDLAYQSVQLNSMFQDVFRAENQVVKTDPRRHTYLGCGLFVRGPRVEPSDVLRNLGAIQPGLRMVGWNRESFKIGLCRHPPVRLPHSVLCLANNTCIVPPLKRTCARFRTLRRRKAFVWQYERVAPGCLGEAHERVQRLMDDYAAVERAVDLPPVRRVAPLF
eukprot:gnl/Trimastix_PCT/1328.p1 GENE.gnl/Trimastix_PCT/1328~~gnl/Trimastix_PCT/1328.p1  ORF type:complete len:462 (-),score=143.83 gnl/Trimastix_PCT/1328:817-2202(-)